MVRMELSNSLNRVSKTFTYRTLEFIIRMFPVSCVNGSKHLVSYIYTFKTFPTTSGHKLELGVVNDKHIDVLPMEMRDRKKIVHILFLRLNLGRKEYLNDLSG